MAFSCHIAVHDNEYFYSPALWCLKDLHKILSGGKNNKHRQIILVSLFGKKSSLTNFLDAEMGVKIV